MKRIFLILVGVIGMGIGGCSVPYTPPVTAPQNPGLIINPAVTQPTLAPTTQQALGTIIAASGQGSAIVPVLNSITQTLPVLQAGVANVQAQTDVNSKAIAAINTAISTYESARPLVPPTAQNYGDLAVAAGTLLAFTLSLFAHKKTVETVLASNDKTVQGLTASLDSSVPAIPSPTKF